MTKELSTRHILLPQANSYSRLVFADRALEVPWHQRGTYAIMGCTYVLACITVSFGIGPNVPLRLCKS